MTDCTGLGKTGGISLVGYMLGKSPGSPLEREKKVSAGFCSAFILSFELHNSNLKKIPGMAFAQRPGRSTG